MRKTLFIALVACTALGATAAFGRDFAQDAQAKVTSTCQSCHGVTGDSISPEIPRLNGQNAEYLTSRLISFRDPTRQTPNAIHAMWDIASHVGDDTIPEIAKYYAAQNPTPALGKGTLAKKGKTIYEHGAGTSLPACQTCHGVNGEGSGAVPRLGGQHAEYLSMQLISFIVFMRTHATMDRNAMYMTDEISRPPNPSFRFA